MDYRLYLDESGSTGADLVKDKAQPWYTSSGFLLPAAKVEQLEESVEAIIAAEHNLQAPELKSTSILKSRRPLARKLFQAIRDHDGVVFASVIDKPFMAACLLAYCLLDGEHNKLVHDTMLDWSVPGGDIGFHQSVPNALFKFLPVDELVAWHEALWEGRERVREVCGQISSRFVDETGQPCKVQHVRKHVGAKSKDWFALRATLEMRMGREAAIQDVFNAYDDSMDIVENETAYAPNRVAFSNVLSLIGSWNGRRYGDTVSIVHDEQRQFELAFRKYQEIMNRAPKSYLWGPIVAPAGGWMKDLTFVDSKAARFVQLADLCSAAAAAVVGQLAGLEPTVSYDAVSELGTALFGEKRAGKIDVSRLNLMIPYEQALRVMIQD